ATDAWAVGQYFTSTTVNPLVLRWDGQQWTQRTVPAPGSGSVLAAVAATSAYDVCAAGGFIANSRPKALIVRWNGTKWVLVPSPSPGQQGNELAGVATTSASDIWAVGDYTTGGVTQVLAAHCC